MTISASTTIAAMVWGFAAVVVLLISSTPCHGFLSTRSSTTRRSSWHYRQASHSFLSIRSESSTPFFLPRHQHRQCQLYSTKKESDNPRDNSTAGGSSAPKPSQRKTTSSTKTAYRPPKNKPPNSKSNSNNPNKRPMIRRTVDSPDANRKLNKAITEQETAMDLLAFLSSQKGALTVVGGNNILNSINFSTAFHRIARFVQYSNNNNNQWQSQPQDPQQQEQQAQKNDRSKVLTDPRFALLMCSAAEAMITLEDGSISFGAREMSNIAWALAKLKLVPPQTSMPVDISQDVEERLRSKSAQVRSLIYQVAKDRQQGKSTAPAWIPALSELSGLLLDAISYRVLDVDGSLFRLQEWANLLWALATSGRAHPEVFSFILASLVKGKQSIRVTTNGAGGLATTPQEWSNSIWALATSGILGPEEEFIPFVAQMMNENPAFLEAFKPQELSNTLWGVATIVSKRQGQPTGALNDAALAICRHVSRQVIARQGQGFKTQEMANTAWALATMAFGISVDIEQAERSDYKCLQTDDLEGDAKLMSQAVQIVYDHAKENLRRYRSQELNNLSWVMARMGVSDMTLMEMIMTDLANPRRKLESQDISTTLWGIASSKFFDRADLYRAVVARWTPEMAARAKPQELSNSVWALATADVVPLYPDAFDTTILSPEQRRTPSNPREDPVITCFAMAAQELMRRPDEFKAQEIKDVLWAFSSNGIRHPQLFRAMAEHLMGTEDGGRPGRGLKDFSVQTVGNTAWAYARQAQLGADTMNRFNNKTNMPRSSGRLAHYMVLFTDVGEMLLQKLFFEIAEMDLKAFDNLKRLKPQDVTNTAWAFAIVGLQRTEFLDAVATELERRTRFFETQELTNGLWALATLNHCPPNLLHRLEKSIISLRRDPKDSSFWTTRSIASVWKRQELANLAWVCAVFGEYPPDLIRFIYMGLVGVGDDPRPDAVKDCYVQARLGPDDGVASTIVMSITYLQMLLDLNTDMDIHLPQDFPDGWLRRGASDQSEPSRRGKSTTAETEGLFEVHDKGDRGDTLRLSTSALQQGVSAALNRIGFRHVVEYILDMATLSQEYGILGARTAGYTGSHRQAEILSLDVANVEDRIGIEVDGPGHFITNIDNFQSAPTDADFVPTKVYKSSKGKIEVVFGWKSDLNRFSIRTNGATVLKLRILKAMGWKIYNIPFWEWSAVDGDTTAEEDYCRSVLK